ncbi:hypothetical protein [Commensalibacter sp. Nvir]|uniref:hypothetical protein n=1 Tax=Commensalibacter sp. Nvir TaxID=3069817 RepID=UPI0030C7D9B8
MKNKTVLWVILFFLLLKPVVLANSDKIIPSTTLREVEKKYVLVICKSENRLNSFIESIKSCYRTAESNSSLLDQCLVMDMTLTSILNYYTQQLNAQPLSLQDTPYANEKDSYRRINKYLLLPRYDFLRTSKEVSNYFYPGIQSIRSTMKKCKNQGGS